MNERCFHSKRCAKATNFSYTLPNCCMLNSTPCVLVASGWGVTSFFRYINTEVSWDLPMPCQAGPYMHKTRFVLNRIYYAYGAVTR